MKLRALAVLLLLVPLPLGLAWHAEDCTPEQGHYALEAAGVYYWHAYWPGHYSFGAWQETNGIAGLQRYDVVFDETCHGEFPADTEIVAWYAL